MNEFKRTGLVCSYIPPDEQQIVSLPEWFIDGMNKNWAKAEAMKIVNEYSEVMDLV